MTSETVVSLPEIQPRNPGKHNSNPYVEKTLSAVLSFVQIFHGEILSVLRPPALSSTLRIELRGDNDFYSQVHHMSANGLSMTTENVQNLPNFLPCTVVNKTGMGSSAALVTSLVGALLNFFDVVNLSSSSKCKENTEVLKEKDLAVTHNLAQFCHTLAQGKVGSGFDVSAACYGSHLYTRFSPDVLADLLAPTSTSHAPKRIYDRVMDLERWDSFVDPFSLPPGVGIMMADVCGGSETPSMVRKVLAWRDGGSEESKTIWPGLVRSNDTIVMMLKRLSNIFGGEDGPAMVNVLSKMDHTGWVDIVSDAEHQTGRIAIPARALSSLRNSMINARVFLRKMGKNAGVPIEPNEQTDLANATMALKGVIAAGVPGAGGNDALYVLYLHGDVESGNGEDIVRARIGELWQSWKGKGNTEVGRCVCPLPGRRRVNAYLPCLSMIAAGVPGAGGNDAPYVLYFH
mmetsp:Transcript_18115/g.41263  ORF Transcript_18115/g.41263 Transcript_18115/m.41263 type:complete len:459 (-) Transcript_18115:5-1381(-)